MSLAAVLAEAGAAGVSAVLENGKLLSRPAGRASAELMAKFKAHRAELMAFLEVSVMDLSAIQAELRNWQALGLAGVPRTAEEAERVAALWHRLDKLTGSWR